MADIVIAGAGSVGCFVGGILAASGHGVTLLGREKTRQELQANGLRVSDLDGLDLPLAPDRFTCGVDPSVLARAEIVLVCVKSGATEEIAGLIGRWAKPRATVISLQNGVRNVDVLRRVLPDQRVVAGVVGFNVLRMGNGRFHKGTEGDIVVEAVQGDPAAVLNNPMLKIRASDRLLAIQWGKLILNLNNALNALSGMPLRAQLENAGWRRVLADQIAEALRILAASGISAKPINGVALAVVPYILRLPNPLFGMIARKMLAMDPTARSSMWEDFEARRPTEIDEFQGVLVSLAGAKGVQAPVSAAVRALVESAETAKNGSPGLSALDVRQRYRD